MHEESRRRCPQLVRAGVVACLFIVTAASAFAQALPPIHYVYDDLNRLIAVVDRDNSAAVYVYDAVGNILAIERHNLADIPGPMGITFVAPGKGKAGTAVTIYGKGFGTSAAQVSVSFNGTSATVNGVVGDRISTSVPAGATTGPITITVPLGTATSPNPFRVLGPITIDPTAAQPRTGATQQFTALAQGGSAIAAFWEVNGIRGGNAAVGTISASGFYTAPAVIPNPSFVIVTALDKDDVSTSASATVTVIPPITGTVTASVSIRVDEPKIVNRSVDALVSVGVAQSATTTGESPLVSVSVEPVVTTVAPPTGARGAVALLVTIDGAGFTGATQLEFLRNNAPDAAITVANLTVNGSGTQATAEVTIDNSAAVGGRVVRITTPAGASTPLGTSGNVFTVQ